MVVENIRGLCAASKTELHKTARGVKLSKKTVFSHQSTAIARTDGCIFFRGLPLPLLTIGCYKGRWNRAWREGAQSW